VSAEPNPIYSRVFETNLCSERGRDKGQALDSVGFAVELEEEKGERKTKQVEWKNRRSSAAKVYVCSGDSWGRNDKRLKGEQQQ